MADWLLSRDGGQIKFCLVSGCQLAGECRISLHLLPGKMAGDCKVLFLNDIYFGHENCFIA
jgi:hypothetical protein